MKSLFIITVLVAPLTVSYNIMIIHSQPIFFIYMYMHCHIFYVSVHFIYLYSIKTTTNSLLSIKQGAHNSREITY